jgi:hypothetical protein
MTLLYMGDMCVVNRHSDCTRLVAADFLAIWHQLLKGLSECFNIFLVTHGISRLEALPFWSRLRLVKVKCIAIYEQLKATNYLWFFNSKAHLSTKPWRLTGGVEVQLHAVLTCALEGHEWSASCPGHFTPGATEPVWTEQWRREKKSLPLPGMEPLSSSP